MIRISNVIFLIFIALLLIVVIFSDGSFEYVTLVLFLVICSVISIITPLVKGVKVYSTPDGVIKVKKYKFSILLQILGFLEEKIPIITKLRLYNEKLITSQIRQTGQSHDAEKMSTNMTRIAVFSFIPCVISSIYLGVLVNELFLIMITIPIILYFTPFLQLKTQSKNRKSAVEEEMAYFLCYVNILQTVGIGLYHSFDTIRGKNIFTRMEKDANEIVKRVRMLNVTQNNSLSIYAASHPSEKFRDFITGYLAKITSVGDVPKYTEEKAKYFFEDYVGAWKRYEKNAQEIFNAIMMITILLPMMIMFSSLIGTASTINVLLIVGTIISPVISAVMLVILGTTQPVTGNIIILTNIQYLLIVIPSVLVGLMIYLVGLDPATSIAVSFLVGGVINMMQTHQQIVKVKTVDKMLPEFMRDVTEMSKAGNNIVQIIQIQSQKNAYRPQFNQILDEISSRLKRGIQFQDATSDITFKSVHVAFIMFLLNRTYSTGGGTPENWNNITEFVSKIHQTKEMVTKSLRPLTLIVYFAPMLMLGISHMMIAMFTGNPDIDTSILVDVPFVGSTSNIDKTYIDRIAVMATLAAIPIGFVAAKIISYTVRDTMPVIIVACTTLVSIHALPYLIDNLGVFQ